MADTPIDMLGLTEGVKSPVENAQEFQENIQQGDTMGAMNMLPRGDMPVTVDPNKGMRGSENLNPVSPPPKEKKEISFK